MTFPTYPEYKDSGVEWLGEVPAHWDVAPISSQFKLRNGYPFKAELFSPEGSPGDRLIRIRDILKDESRIFTQELCPSWAKVENGDVLIGMDGDFNVAYWGKGLAKLNQRVCALRGKSLAWDKFMFYGITQPLKIINDLTFSTTVKHLSSDQILKIRFPLPPASEASSIVAFLDHETARIDALVEQQQRLIELLKEKRQAVISHAVTKGLDPDVPMKDSGVEWLGEIPAHWDVKRVKHVVGLMEQGWSPQCDNIPVEDINEWGVLKVGCVNNGMFNERENKKLPQGLQPRPDLSIKSDDVLISRANTRDLVGSCAVPTVDHPNLMISDKLFRLRLSEGVADPRYFALFMGTPEARKIIELEATGASSSMLNIGQSTILEMPFPCPPMKEQVKIRDEVVRQTWSLLNLAGQALELQERLEERRSALISAAVTGKIDVRGWQADQQSEQPEVLMAAEARATYG